jgi:hypothetical protein
MSRAFAPTVVPLWFFPQEKGFSRSGLEIGRVMKPRFASP